MSDLTADQAARLVAKNAHCVVEGRGARRQGRPRDRRHGAVAAVVGAESAAPGGRREADRASAGTRARRGSRADAGTRAAGARAKPTLLLLDTCKGSAAERLYTSLGWTRVGEVPNFALNPDGSWCDTVFFYKQL